MFEINHVNKALYHIKDAMGVCATLIVGTEKALLFDTGYGLFNLRGLIKEITPLPLMVVLSHGHHDHALGYSQFEKVYLHEADLPCLKYYTREAQRDRVLQATLSKGLAPEDNLPLFQTELLPLAPCLLDLGGITAEILHLPGHTPGSLGILVADVLLIADNWNPTTWVFFPECEPLAKYRRTMEGLLSLPFNTVLSSHCLEAIPAQRLRDYVHGLASLGGEPVTITPYENIHTYACHPEANTTLVYDRNKL